MPPTTTTTTVTSSERNVVCATRLHLGNAKEGPSIESLTNKLKNFYHFAKDSCRAKCAVIAVDATPLVSIDSQKDGSAYDLLASVRVACQAVLANERTIPLHVVPVTPWGKFVPALNALIAFACNYQCSKQIQENSNFSASESIFDTIIFVSAETTAPPQQVQTLLQTLTEQFDTTLVVGPCLAGHHFQQTTSSVTLNGRTCPWNTLAAWNIKKLALTGFQLVSEGLLTPDDQPSFGVEEVVAVAVLQKLLGPTQAQAKLVQLPNVAWDVNFDQDPERQAWHRQKMQSKLERAQRQLDLLGLSGIVQHVKL